MNNEVYRYTNWYIFGNGILGIKASWPLKENIWPPPISIL